MFVKSQWISLVVIACFLMFPTLRHQDNNHLFFIVPTVCFAAVYFLLNDQWFNFFAVLTLISISTSLSFLQTFQPSYFLLALIAAVVMWGIYFYKKSWLETVSKTEIKKEAMLKDMQTLRDRFNARVESLHYLERQVSGLIKLFEMARDFNECLSVAELINVVDQNISGEVTFTRGSLILLDVQNRKEIAFTHSLSFGSKKRSTDEDNVSFAEFCLRKLGKSNTVIKLEHLENDHAPHIHFPLWIFPLAIDMQNIAVLAIEGSTANDFPKFEILASQLGLQVKKIRLYENVKEISIIDGLTGVFVRRHFLERFQEELRRALRYNFGISVLMVDVDHFKSYNDNFGHLVGDKALREVAQVIRENIRRVDVLGRYGGEEFIVVAPEIDKKKGAELAERIRSSIARKRLRIYDEETKMTVSIGLCSFPEDLQQDAPVNSYQEAFITELIDKADKALYRAKQEGRNQVCVFNK